MKRSQVATISFEVLDIAFVIVLLTFVLATDTINFALANFMPPPPPPLPRIYIRANGTVEPTSAPVQASGNVYTLTASPGSVVIEVQRDNVVLNGAGFSLTGKYYENGIVLTGRINVTVRGVEAQQFGVGIYMAGSVNCTVEENRLRGNQRGIQLISNSKGNLLSNNLISNNSGGVSIYFCGGNILRSNAMQNNSINLNVYVGYMDNHDTLTSSELENDIDASNTVDGKPVCYWINQHNRIVPTGSGYVGLINCDGITAKGLTLTNNGQGILLFGASNCTISKNTVVGNADGVWADATSCNNTIVGNNFENGGSGVYLQSAKNITVVGNSIINASKYGINLENTRNSIVVGNAVKKSGYFAINLAGDSGSVISQNVLADNNNPWEGVCGGICVGGTMNDIVSDNLVTGNKVGFYVHDVSAGNLFLNNTIRANTNGLWFYYTTPYAKAGNTFRANRIESNQYNLKIESGYTQDIDASNTVNGKPLIYWVDQHDKTVPPNAGFVGLVGCSGITVQGLNISANWQGIFLCNTTDSVITKNILNGNTGYGILANGVARVVFSYNKLTDNALDGVYVEGQNCTFKGNLIVGNGHNGITFEGAENSATTQNNITHNGAAGIELFNGKNNLISENFILQNQLGIHNSYSTHNTISRNAITENYGFGLCIEGSQSSCTITQNNFKDNNVSSLNLQVSDPWPCAPNAWDNGSQGNYWSDYFTRYTNASEIGSTGVGNTPFVINEKNLDHYPLLNPVEIPTVPSVATEDSSPSPAPSSSTAPLQTLTSTPSSQNQSTPPPSAAESSRSPTDNVEGKPPSGFFSTELTSKIAYAAVIAVAVALALAIGSLKLRQDRKGKLLTSSKQ